ncbi:MAG TPA: CYTH domain-containing protein [Candidatus Gemmiger faecigallinarum]|nr:CYTH domain-containing protein [Candidatus Gemmiger faecigallinarum]
MEIERKWMVEGWPHGLTCTEEYRMDQGYFSVRPTVRIRREALSGGGTRYVLCFKGAGTLAREEIETDIDAALYERLKALLGKPLIAKVRRGYALPGGLTLEVNLVDAGQPGEFFYAEIEYPTTEAALAWQPDNDALRGYLSSEVTGQPGASMGEYWLRTRGPAE